jgi:hypothetical protein
MAANRIFSLLILLLCIPASAFALIMKGKVYDLKTGNGLANVSILNTFSEINIITDNTGEFSLEVEKGHLIEFKRIGYKIVRIRVNAGELPYYSIAMTEGAIDLDEVEIRGNNYKTDSIEKRETYKWAIEHYRLDGLDVIQHPFDALSKKNRQIWAFQKRYEYFEQEKFIDFVFNERLIRKVSGMQDSTAIALYRRYYRPSYMQIKLWSEYEFLKYIKETAILFQKRRE